VVVVVGGLAGTGRGGGLDGDSRRRRRNRWGRGEHEINTSGKMLFKH
jgi:hypothetical protein